MNGYETNDYCIYEPIIIPKMLKEKNYDVYAGSTFMQQEIVPSDL
jgi:hypothetical protein